MDEKYIISSMEDKNEKILIPILVIIIALLSISCTKPTDMLDTMDSTSKNEKLDNNSNVSNHSDINPMSNTADKFGITDQNYPRSSIKISAII